MTFDIEKLIPRAMLVDKNGYALAKAIERAFEIVGEAVQSGIDIIQDPEKMPEWRLDELAQELGCLYDYSASIQKKRYWIKNAITMFSIYGTPQAIVSFLEGLFAGVDVEEFWKYSTGEPFHFNVVLTGNEFPADRISWVRRVVELTKNTRSVLDNVVVDHAAEIIVSSDTDTFDMPYLRCSEDTYTEADTENDFIPGLMYLIMHIGNPQIIGSLPPIQAIIQKFQGLNNF